MTVNITTVVAEQLEVHLIELDAQGYDENGSYWGTGTPLYWVTTPDGKHDCFVRADDAQRARLIAAEEIPLRSWERGQAEVDRNTPAVIEPEHRPDGTYGFPEAAQPVSGPHLASKRGIAIRQSDSSAGQADGEVPTSPARPAAKAGGSGPTGQAGPT